MQITEVVRELTKVEGQVVSVMLYLEKEDPLEGDTYDMPKQTGEYERLVAFNGKLVFDRNNSWVVTDGNGKVKFNTIDVVDIKPHTAYTIIHICW